MRQTSVSMISEPEHGTAQGFTLVEILVVVLLMGLVASLLVANQVGSSRRQAFQVSVSELFGLMQAASEQAVLDNQEMGLEVDGRHYRFLVYDEFQSQWRVAADRIYRERSLPPATTIRQTTDSVPPRLSDDAGTPQPDIVFFSSGETTPFRLELQGNADDVARYVIASDGFQPMTLVRPGGEGS